MSRSTVEAAVFDLGGVLIDWDPRYLYRKIFRSEQEMEHFLANVCTKEWNAELDRGRPFEEMIPLLSLEHPEYAKEIGAYQRRWGEMLGGSFTGSVEVLQALHAVGYPLYALTNWSAETFHLARARYGFLSLFEETVVSGEVGLIKPDPRIYALLIKQTGIEPTRTVFVDDREENVREAKKFGFKGIIYRDGSELRSELTGLGLLR